MIAIFKINEKTEYQLKEYWHRLQVHDDTGYLVTTADALGYITQTDNVYMLTANQLFFAGRRESLHDGQVIPVEVLASFPVPWVYIND